MNETTLEILSHEEREEALRKMNEASSIFYSLAVRTGVHPFIEFTGLMNEYIKICRNAHNNGIDFSACNTHTNSSLPMEPHEIDYINEKLECIFTGRSVINTKD